MSETWYCESGCGCTPVENGGHEGPCSWVLYDASVHGPGEMSAPSPAVPSGGETDVAACPLDGGYLMAGYYDIGGVRHHNVTCLSCRTQWQVDKSPNRIRFRAMRILVEPGDPRYREPRSVGVASAPPSSDAKTMAKESDSFHPSSDAPAVGEGDAIDSDADPAEHVPGDDLDALERCAWAWAPEARLLGNVRAQTVRELCAELQSYRRTAPSSSTSERQAFLSGDDGKAAASYVNKIASVRALDAEEISSLAALLCELQRWRDDDRTTPSSERRAAMDELLEWIWANGETWWGNEISEDIMPILARHGLAEFVAYDPARHGDGIDAERGDMIWHLTAARIAASREEE